MNKYTDSLITLLKESELLASKNKESYVTTMHFLLCLLNSDRTVKNIFLENNISYKLIKSFLIKGNNNDGYLLYSKELLESIEGSIYEEEEINEYSILINVIGSSKTKVYKMLSKIGADKNKIINDIKKRCSFRAKLFISSVATNLNEKALNNQIDPVIGREKEINQIIQILQRKNKNNPLLIGEAGSGKSATVEELARRITIGNVPSFLKNKEIYSLNISSVVAGTKYRGEFEEKMNTIIKEVTNNPNIILFIDEIHTVMGAGGAEGAIDASNILKPYLARGNIKLIGATTTNEYSEYIMKDNAFDRRFQKVTITSPSDKETFNILCKIKSSYEDYHHVTISNNIIKSIISLSSKYIRNRHNPDKSIDILDLVCALRSLSISKSNKVTKTDLYNVMSDKYNSYIFESMSFKKFNKMISNLYKKYKDIFINLNEYIDYLYSYLSINNDSPKTTLIDHNEEFFDELINTLKVNKIFLDGANFSSYNSLSKLVGSEYNNKPILYSIIDYPNSFIVIKNFNSFNDEIKSLIKSAAINSYIELFDNTKIDLKNTSIVFVKEECYTTSGFYSEEVAPKDINYDFILK